jgi:primosomal protein N' (replication factor Y)
MQYAEVAVAVPVDHLYTYSVPEDLRDEIAVGKRVLIPFGKKYMIGYVVQLSKSTDIERVKNIVDVLDPEPVVTQNILRLTEWIADYYLCPWGIAIKAALPAGIDIVHDTRVTLNSSDFENLEDPFSAIKGGVQKKVLAILRQYPTLSLRELQKKAGKKSLYSSLHALERQGIIQIDQVVKSSKVKPRSLQHVTLRKPPETILVELPVLAKRAPQQAEILRILTEHFPDDMTIVELQTLVQSDPRSVVKALEQKGFVHIYAKHVRRKPLEQFEYQETSHLPLTPKQQEILNRVKMGIHSKTFSPILLHGVTGSGKTEIYIQAIAYLISLQRTALVLVPEISLTPLLVSWFLSRFGEKIAVLHSGLSTGERFDEWQRIRKGEVDVVIGARSAIFAPLDHLGLIVVDEEHDMSYKQDTVPRYHGRDTAVMRAQFEQIPVLLGSATPSLESYYNTQTNKYHLTTIADRIDHRPLPAVEIVDMRKEDGRHRQRIFSNRLEEAMREVLAKKEQVLLFLNLRGFANFYMCQECGFVYDCPRCSVTLTYHASSNRLQCHYCDFSRLPPTTCEQCNSPTVQYRGIGTEQVEQDLQWLFPDAVVTRMDKDTVSGKHAHYKILRRFERKEIDILVGTQMVTKGHDFPNVTLVGVIAAETALHLPDFRASERTFQILTQVAGRTGRGHLGGEVIIQTYTPSHYAILAAQNHDYAAFYTREITYPENLNYPPFSRVVNLLLQGRDDTFTRETAKQLARYLRVTKHKTLIALGPTPAAITKLRNKYRYQILLKSPYSQYMRRFVKEQIVAFRKTSHLKDVQFIVDVDPVNLL